ncbi:MAG: site-specific integrase [Oscillospiraceae bacterium]|jgi:integrase|nr:site-specific integrase [Oscillospiraceae bacterium]
MKRGANGDGTIFQRQDGRWMAQAYVTLTDGTRKRLCITAKKREDVKAKLAEALLQEKKKIPFAERRWTVGEYLDYWVENVLPKTTRRKTAIEYERSVKMYLKPALGGKRLDALNVRCVQTAFDLLRDDGVGIRTIHKARAVLSAALGKAMRDELVFRNVAGSRLIDLPKYKPKTKTLWTSEQLLKFIEVAENHPLYVGFLAGFLYGMREGEILGLRWCDLDFKREVFTIRQQMQRVDGQNQALPVKTESGNRTLPLCESLTRVLLQKARDNSIDVENCYIPDADYSLKGLVLTTRLGTPVSARNFLRSFYRLTARAELPRITFHTTRHIASTAHKNAGAPIKDAQGILGHADSNITRQIYQHCDIGVQRRTIETVEKQLALDAVAATRSHCCQKLLSRRITPRDNGGENGLATRTIMGLGSILCKP